MSFGHSRPSLNRPFLVLTLSIYLSLYSYLNLYFYISITVEFLDAFNKQKNDIENTINSVSLATKQVNSLCEQVKTAFNSEDIDRLSKQLADVVKSAQRDAAKGKTLLDTLKKDGETCVKSNPKSERVQAYKAQYQRLCK